MLKINAIKLGKKGQTWTNFKTIVERIYTPENIDKFYVSAVCVFSAALFKSFSSRSIKMRFISSAWLGY